MQAFRIHEGGEGRFEEAPDPVAGPGEVVVELRAAALNRRDILVRNPPGPAYDFPKPFVAGHDGAGVRRDTGEEVVIYPCVDWGPNDDLPGALKWLGGPLDGTFAELIAVPEENIFPKPARLSFEEAASLPVAGMTAYRALHPIGRLAAGETVLVLGAGSGASTFAIALAAQAGARVLVTSSSAREDRALEGARRRGRRALHGGRLRSRRARARAGRRRPRRRLGRLDLARLPARAPARRPARRLRRHRRRHGRARRALPVPQLPLDSRHDRARRRGSSATSWRPSGRARGGRWSTACGRWQKRRPATRRWRRTTTARSCWGSHRDRRHRRRRCPLGPDSARTVRAGDEGAARCGRRGRRGVRREPARRRDRRDRAAGPRRGASRAGGPAGGPTRGGAVGPGAPVVGQREPRSRRHLRVGRRAPATSGRGDPALRARVDGDSGRPRRGSRRGREGRGRPPLPSLRPAFHAVHALAGGGAGAVRARGGRGHGVEIAPGPRARQPGHALRRRHRGARVDAVGAGGGAPLEPGPRGAPPGDRGDEGAGPAGTAGARAVLRRRRRRQALRRQAARPRRSDGGAEPGERDRRAGGRGAARRGRGASGNGPTLVRDESAPARPGAPRLDRPVCSGHRGAAAPVGPGSAADSRGVRQPVDGAGGRGRPLLHGAAGRRRDAPRQALRRLLHLAQHACAGLRARQLVGSAQRPRRARPRARPRDALRPGSRCADRQLVRAGAGRRGDSLDVRRAVARRPSARGRSGARPRSALAGARPDGPRGVVRDRARAIRAGCLRSQGRRDRRSLRNDSTSSAGPSSRRSRRMPSPTSRVCARRPGR